MSKIVILNGDCRETLARLPSRCIQTCITSPPYYGLRNYGVDSQIGLEESPASYVQALVEVFWEVKRVLRDDGTVWLNLGDSYATNRGKGNNVPQTKRKSNSYPESAPHRSKVLSVAPKNLLGIPWRVAFALQEDGWYLRSEIIWEKPNALPESVRDRPNRSHEYVFLLTKKDRYFYDHEAVKEPVASPAMGKSASFKREGSKRGQPIPGHTMGTHRPNREEGYPSGYRNKRSVWNITTKPYKGAHFATFPPDLVLPCILAGTSEHGACAQCGAPYRRLTERSEPDAEWQRLCGGDSEGEYHGEATKDYATAGAQNASATKARILAGMRKTVTVGWDKTCSCLGYEVRPCVVLDPFAGAGTTGLVAKRLGRDAVLIELNPEYCKMSRERIDNDPH